MSGLRGKVAAVTGAGSGIGRALAVGLAGRGARLAVSDVDGVGLAETADLVKAAGADVHSTVVDVTSRTQVAAWASAVAAAHGVVHQIYNNAGIAAAALPLNETPYEDIERVLDVNLWGVVHGTKEFLPHLLASGAGHVVNVSSLNGFLAQPGMAAYSMSKFAVRALSEALRAEAFRDRLPLRVTVVHPGGVRTAIARGVDGDDAALSPAERAAQERRRKVYEEKLFTMEPEVAARQVLDAVERGRGRVLLGQAKGVDRLVRLIPASYPRAIALWDRRTFG